jgi:hypothetical protein
MIGDVDHPLNPLETHGIYVEGNMENISETIPINISKTPDVVENVFIGATVLQEEIHSYMTLFKDFVMFSLGLMRKCQE